MYVLDSNPNEIAIPTTPTLPETQNPVELNRYFTWEDKEQRCRICGDFGHTSFSCINPNYRIRCIYCAGKGHTAFHCKSVICFNCNRVGHKTDKCRNYPPLVCSICCKRGHEQNSCLYREVTEQEIKTLSCYCCSQRGHVTCLDVQNSNSSHYCSRCGKCGHPYNRCMKNREPRRQRPWTVYTSKKRVKE